MSKSANLEEASKDRGEESAPQKSVFREYAEALIIAALFLRFANTFVVQTFYIPSGSMENTLLVGDHLFVNRYIYGAQSTGLDRLLPGRSIARGDIVVFRSPEDPTLDLVKRCIGLPGDQIDVVDKQLFINGKRVEDSTYVLHKDVNLYPDRIGFNDQGRIRDNFGPYTVPAESYFCMGDNRDFSYDSRFWGPLPVSMIKGRVSMIYWSYGGETSDGRWAGLAQTLKRFGRTIAGFVSRTRWDRSFSVVH